eukprot:gene24197-29383_t
MTQIEVLSRGKNKADWAKRLTLLIAAVCAVSLLTFFLQQLKALQLAASMNTDLPQDAEAVRAETSVAFPLTSGDLEQPVSQAPSPQRSKKKNVAYKDLAGTLGRYYVEHMLGENLSEGLTTYKMHTQFLSRNCTLAGCAPRPIVNLTSGTDADNIEWARSSMTGEACRQPSIPLHPFNFIESYSQEVKRIHALLKCRAAFAFLRQNDGERDAVSRSMSARWTFKDRSSEGEKWETSKTASEQLRDDILSSMQVRDRRYMLGLSVPTCVEGLRNEYRSGGGNRRVLKFFCEKDENNTLKYKPAFHSWSYSNLFSHRGGHASIAFMKQIARKPTTFVVANEKVKALAVKKKLPWAARILVFPMTLPQTWEGATREKYLGQ